jgi:hypothetical protein
MFWEAPDTIEPARNTTMPNKKTGLRPKISTNRPYNGMETVEVSIYEIPTCGFITCKVSHSMNKSQDAVTTKVRTHPISSEAPKPEEIVGKAVATIV